MNKNGGQAYRILFKTLDYICDYVMCVFRVHFVGF